VINENDTVATSEIRYGDNDRLAARVASMMGADLLVLLSDIDGLYTAPPHTNPDARLIPVVPKITPEIEAMAGGAASEYSRGGMKTKVDAAKIATAAGATMAIALGKPLHPLRQISEGGTATWFLPEGNPVTERKKWISGHLETRGLIVIDAGAVRALRSGKSLLPAGVRRVEGRFQRGDAIIIQGPSGEEIGRGLVAYDMADAERIAGRNSNEIAAILGYSGRAAMVHRDDMALRGE
jgi:glutamate 5-kinase